MAPAGFAAVQTASTSYLFYTNTLGELAYLKSQSQNEAESSGYYTPKTIKVGGLRVLVSGQSSQIAAISYTWKDKEEIRVYFVSNSGVLQELATTEYDMAKTEEGQWNYGSPGGDQAITSPSSFAASVKVESGKQDQLKVYYTVGSDLTKVWCTWQALGETDWRTRKITRN